VGSGVGALTGYRDQKKRNKNLTEKGKSERGISPFSAATVGAIGGGITGYGVGKVLKVNKRLRQNAKAIKAENIRSHGGMPGSRVAAGELHVPSWLKGMKTKKDAKAAYLRQASYWHTDKNKAPNARQKFEETTKAWKDFENHPDGFSKLSASRGIVHVPKAVAEAADLSYGKAGKGWSWAKKHLRSRRLRHAALSNATLKGGAMGAVAGAGMGALPQNKKDVQEDIKDGGTRMSRKERMLRGAVTMGTTGALTGKLIGSIGNLSRTAKKVNYRQIQRTAKLQQMAEKQRSAEAAKAGKFRMPSFASILDEVQAKTKLRAHKRRTTRGLISLFPGSRAAKKAKLVQKLKKNPRIKNLLNRNKSNPYSVREEAERRGKFGKSKTSSIDDTFAVALFEEVANLWKE
jgi:hypothetical protein